MYLDGTRHNSTTYQEILKGAMSFASLIQLSSAIDAEAGEQAQYGVLNKY